MQMRKQQYGSVSHRKRAAQLRADGAENLKAGFNVLAEICFAEADLLDPPVRTDRARG